MLWEITVRSSAYLIDIKFGHDIDVKSRLIDISNVGHNGKVVAGAMIEMEYTVKNFVRSTTSVDSFFITGEGQLLKQTK